MDSKENLNAEQRLGVDLANCKIGNDDYVDYSFLKDNPGVPIFVRSKE